jgi:hypothetical protein
MSGVTPQPPLPIPAQGCDESPSTIPSVLATARSAAKMGLEVLRDASNAFAPLTSVAAGLCTVLKHFEVRVPLSGDLK